MSCNLDLSVLASKPERLWADDVLSDDIVMEIEEDRDPVIGEVAGRDSVAAIVQAATFWMGVTSVLPTIAYSGTEYGNWDSVCRAIDIIKERAAENEKIVFEPVLVGSPKLWWALNGRFVSRLEKTFGFYSPCLGCHLYMHLVRVPLCWDVGCKRIVTGERENHGDCEKINQMAVALDAYTEVLAEVNLQLLMPMRQIAENEPIEKLVGPDWPAGEKQLSCVFSGNYRDVGGEVVVDSEHLKAYFDDFAKPAGAAILQAWKHERQPDYEKIVAGVLG